MWVCEVCLNGFSNLLYTVQATFYVEHFRWTLNTLDSLCVWAFCSVQAKSCSSGRWSWQQSGVVGSSGELLLCVYVSVCACMWVCVCVCVCERERERERWEREKERERERERENAVQGKQWRTQSPQLENCRQFLVTKDHPVPCPLTINNVNWPVGIVGSPCLTVQSDSLSGDW